MASEVTELKQGIQELAGDHVVNEHGHAGALDVVKEHYDRLKENDQEITDASSALIADTTINHLHKLTGVEALMKEYLGAAIVEEGGIVESVKQMVEDHSQMAGNAVTILGESFLIGPTFDSIEKTIQVGDVSKTVSVVFSDPAEGVQLEEIPETLRIGAGVIRIGAEVRHVSLDKVISLAFVVRIHNDPKLVDLAVFDTEQRTVGFEKAVQYSYGIMARTWHWPKD